MEEILYVLLLQFSSFTAQNWWNFEDQINPFKPPAFTPLPNQRFTHDPEVIGYGPMSNDVVVNIPKAGMGTFIGSSMSIDYDYTWSEWPPKKGRLVNYFLGIPYAAPPIRDQRFRNPVPAYLDTRYPWYAKKYRPACIQSVKVFAHLFPNSTDMNEDCLYLNIFYPNRTWEDPKTLYPVIVHIHGGSYVVGSSHNYPGHALASNGVVVVTFNYRLGPFGFLSTGDSASIGNYGLWDQLLALRWVKDNIEWFRGDPSQITLMGESAGGASVGILTVSPASRNQDLFQRVIMTSGSDLSNWAISNPDEIRARYYAIELGRLLNCSSVQSREVFDSQKAMYGESWKPNTGSIPPGEFGNSSVNLRLTVPYMAHIDASALVRCLRHSKSADEINLAAKDILPLRGATQYIWTPVLDGTAGFLPRMPLDERKQGRFAKLPILAGVVHDEGSGTLMQRMHRWEGRTIPIEEFTDMVARRTIGNILNNENVYRFNATAQELYTRYTWWPNLSNNTARWERMVAIVSDYEINAPLEAVVRFHAAYSEQAYFYEFAYVSPNDTHRSQPLYGVYHGAEQPFLLGFPFMNRTFWTQLFDGQPTPALSYQNFVYPHDHNISAFMMELWTNFVKYGNPTPQPVQNITWMPFKPLEEGYLFIYRNSSMRYKFRPVHMAFWRERFLKLAEPVPPSSPLYYFHMFHSQLATIVLGSLILLLLVILVIFIVLNCRRPEPDEFRHDVRLAVPGAAPESAFQTAFKDAFASRVSPASDLLEPTPFCDQLAMHVKYNRGAMEMNEPTSSDVTTRLLLSDPYGSIVSHPPPPKIPSSSVSRVAAHPKRMIPHHRNLRSDVALQSRFVDRTSVLDNRGSFTMDL
ncbi:hypothetical protein AHF37_05355 [Paragonimus kellicotti]|nr:hypothetical protein AHF37_05355 [Paragonimus kellicotti]